MDRRPGAQWATAFSIVPYETRASVAETGFRKGEPDLITLGAGIPEDMLRMAHGS